MVNEKRIAQIHIWHTTAIGLGAVFLAISILFYSFIIQYIIALMGMGLTKEEIQEVSTGTFVDYSIFFGVLGVAIIVSSTLISHIAIGKSNS